MNLLRRTVACWMLCACAGFAQSAVSAGASVAVTHPVYPVAESELGRTIAEILADPSVSRAHWGIAVTTMDGTPIFGMHEGEFFRPASNAKLFTTAAAMSLLGPDATVETRVIGKLGADGVVAGDLYLRGGGDASFGTDDVPFVEARAADTGSAVTRAMDALAAQVAATGVKAVRGKVIGDDSAFVTEAAPDGWEIEDSVWGHGALPSALDIGDNAVRMVVTPGKMTPQSTQRATVTLDQNGVDVFAVERGMAGVETVPRGYPQSIEVERDGEHELRVHGQIAVDAHPDVEHIALPDPAEYAAEAFRAALLRNGVAVDGVAEAHHQPVYSGVDFSTAMRAPLRCESMTVEGGECSGDCMVFVPEGQTLAKKTSPALAADVKFTLKMSQNLHAETFLRRLGRRVTCGDGSAVAGARLVRAWLLHAGLDGDDFVFYDGSGLSTKDLVTPRATAQLLAYAAKQPWFAQWKDALPVGGVDGTLSLRFKDAPLKGHVFAKTGTLGETRALSGYVDAASGRSVIFVIFADNHAPGSTADRAAADRIVAAIAAAN